MSFLADNVLDNGVQYITDNGDRIDICSSEPTTATEAQVTNSLGNKSGLTMGSPENGASSGRRSIVPAITDGSVTATGTASHWALTSAASPPELIAAGALSSSQGVTNGNTFTLGAISITIPDVA